MFLGFTVSRNGAPLKVADKALDKLVLPLRFFEQMGLPSLAPR